MAEKFQWISFPYFGGGLNNAQPATEIGDDEVAELLNFEFDLSDDLKARNGFTKYNLTPDFTARITSIFNFITVAGVNNIIITSGADILKDAAGSFSSIKGALTLPTNNYWQWAAFTDLAIGVNQANTGDDIVKWSGIGNAAALALTGIVGAPVGFHSIAVFNNRLWLVANNLPSRVYYSSLGDPEDWSTTGGFIEIGYNDGDKIIGIAANRGRLFIFKRRKTYQLNTGIGGLINTDADGWSVELLSSNIGCVSRYTIQTVLDDMLFLTDEGIASINAVTEFGDFKTTIISRKVKELSVLNLNIDTFGSAVYSPKALYLLSVPKLSTGTVNNRIYVFDYKKIRENKPRWTIFESTIINPATLAIVLVNGRKTLFLGGDTPLFYLCKWDNENEFSDNGEAVIRLFRSKSFSFNTSLERIDVNRFALKLGFTKADLSATIEIRFNEDDSLRTSFPISLMNQVSESLWDSAVWNLNTFSTNAINTQMIERKLATLSRGRDIQLKFINTQVDQDVVIKDQGYEVDLLTIENA